MLQRVLRTVRLDTIDGRSQAAVLMRRQREDLVDQLGGDPSPAERLLVDQIVKQSLISTVVFQWLLTRQSLVRDGGALLPAAMQHATIAGNLCRMINVLGLKRRQPEARDLQSYIAQKAREETRRRRPRTLTPPEPADGT